MHLASLPEQTIWFWLQWGLQDFPFGPNWYPSAHTQVKSKGPDVLLSLAGDSKHIWSQFPLLEPQGLRPDVRINNYSTPLSVSEHKTVFTFRLHTGVIYFHAVWKQCRLSNHCYIFTIKFTGFQNSPVSPVCPVQVIVDYGHSERMWHCVGVLYYSTTMAAIQVAAPEKLNFQSVIDKF